MREIKLTRGKVTIVDDEDFERLNAFKWTANKIGNIWYAVRCVWGGGTNKSILMHRFIKDVADRETYVDHINGNGLDNRRSNLRLCDHKQNQANRPAQMNNTTGFKGVSFDVKRNRWVAQLTVNRKRVLMQRFDSAIEAARAYDNAALEYHGEFARLNFPKGYK